MHKNSPQSLSSLDVHVGTYYSTVTPGFKTMFAGPSQLLLVLLYVAHMFEYTVHTIVVSQCINRCHCHQVPSRRHLDTTAPLLDLLVNSK